MVREAKPLTSIMPVPTPKKGRLVLEVQDPEAIANLGEQLSLANQLLDLDDLSDSPIDGVVSSTVVALESAQARSSATTKLANRKSTRSKATNQSTGSKTSAKSRSTASQAKQQNSGEPMLSVPVSSGADATTAQMRDRMEQMGAVMAQMQQRLNDLQASADSAPQSSNPQPTNPAEISPTLSGTGRSHPSRSNQSRTRNPRLPDWHEPELRSHYTLQQSARAYEALEALHQHRKLQTAEMAELVQAKTIAAQLRPPAELPGIRPSQQSMGVPTDRPMVRRSRRTRRAQPAFRFRLNRRQLMDWTTSRLPVPSDPSAKIVDLAMWVAGSIALRLVVKSLIYLFPALVVPLNLLMALPAIVAAYLAFCVPNGRSDVIYRLLLLTLGLFLGSRF